MMPDKSHLKVSDYVYFVGTMAMPFYYAIVPGILKPPAPTAPPPLPPPPPPQAPKVPDYMSDEKLQIKGIFFFNCEKKMSRGPAREHLAKFSSLLGCTLQYSAPKARSYEGHVVQSLSLIICVIYIKVILSAFIKSPSPLKEPSNK